MSVPRKPEDSVHNPGRRRKKQTPTGRRSNTSKPKRSAPRILVRHDSISSLSYIYRANTSESSPNLPARYWHTSVCSKKYMWVYGGYHEQTNEILSNLILYEFSTSRLITLDPPEPLPPRLQHSSVLFEDKMVVFGGFDGVSVSNVLFSVFEDGSYQIMNTNGDPPPPRKGHQGIRYQNTMYIFGGMTNDSSVLLDDLYAYDFPTSTWTKVEVKGVNPSPRVFSSSCVVGDKIYCYGGCDASGCDLGDFYQFSPLTNIWVSIPVQGKYIPPGRSGHTLTTLRREKDILLFGGDEKATAFEIYKYSLSEQCWSMVRYGGDTGEPRKWHTSADFGLKLFIFGGKGSNSSMLDVIEGNVECLRTAEEDEQLARTQQEWEATAMKRNPDILALKEKLRAFSSDLEPSYSISAWTSKTEDRKKIPPRLIVQLIMEMLCDCGYKKTLVALEKDTGIPYVAQTNRENGLRNLLDFAARLAPDYPLFSPELKNYKWLWDQNMVDSEIKNQDHLPGYYELTEETKNDNIWDDDESTMLRQHGEVVAGNLNVLLMHLVQRAGKEFRSSFLWCFLGWTTSEKLFQKLVELFEVPEDVTRTDAKRIRKSVTNTIKAWLEECPLDFQEPALQDCLQAFLDVTLRDNRESYVKEIRNAHKKSLKVIERRTTQNFSYDKKNPPPDPNVPKNIFARDLPLDDVPVIELARQLTLHFHHQLCLIPMAELAAGGWKSGGPGTGGPGTGDENCKNISRMCLWYHRVRLWAQNDMESDPKVRLKKFKYLISVCDHLWELQNFMGLAAIIEGVLGVTNLTYPLKADFAFEDPNLNKATQEITKLKHTWIPFLFNPQQTEYQKLLEEGRQKPCVPYLQNHLTNLLKIIEKEPNFVPNTTNVINFSKSIKLFKLLNELREMQQTKYNLLPVFQIHVFFDAFPEYEEGVTKKLKPRKV